MIEFKNKDIKVLALALASLLFVITTPFTYKRINIFLYVIAFDLGPEFIKTKLINSISKNDADYHRCLAYSMNSKKINTRLRSLYLASEFKKNDFRVIERGINDPNVFVKGYAIKLIGEDKGNTWPKEKQITLLLSALNKSDEQMKIMILWALGSKKNLLNHIDIKTLEKHFNSTDKYLDAPWPRDPELTPEKYIEYYMTFIKLRKALNHKAPYIFTDHL